MGDPWVMASVREAAHATWGINHRQSVLKRWEEMGLFKD